MRRRGFGIMEGLLALLILLLTAVTFLTVFRSSYQHATLSRNRSLAIQLMRSLVAEVDAHPFGMKEPKDWGVREATPATVITEGRPVEMKFAKNFAYQNGSFVGTSSGDRDVVTITVSWQEAAGKGDAGGVKTETVRIPVWQP